MSPQPNSRNVTFEGKTHTFPADATDDEIRQALGGAPAPKPAPATDPLAGIRGKRALTQQEQGIDAMWSQSHPDMIERGMRTILDPIKDSMASFGRGLHSLVHPGEQPWQSTASDLIEGGGGLALPFAVPSMISRPLAAAAGGLMGTAAQKGGEGLARSVGASPEASRLVGDVAGVTGGPLLTKGTGALLKKPAPRLFENALGIRPTDSAYGAEPGKFGLEETSSVRPAGVAKQARAAIAGKSAALDASLTDAERNGATLSVDPARNLVRSRIADASGANSTITPRELRPMNRFLTKPTDNFRGATEYPSGANTPISFQQQPTGLVGPSGAPMTRPALVKGTSPTPLVAGEQPPTVFRDIKGQFDRDFIRNWSPNVNTKGQLGVAREAYGAMANEVNQKIPGAAELNRGMQSLIPVGEAADKTAFKTGPMGRVIDRVTRPTGGLVGPLLAFGKGGPVAAAGMLTGQELAADPTTKLIGARGLWNGGGALGSRQAAMGAGLIPLLRRAGARQDGGGH